MTRCPEGHDSGATDYCDVCGTPMSAPPAPVPSPAPADVPASDPGAPSEDASSPVGDLPATQECPHCSSANSVDNLFCEVCGFDFTTGVMPRVPGGEPTYLDAPAGPTATSVEEPDAPARSDEPVATSPDAAGLPARTAETPEAEAVEADADPAPSAAAPPSTGSDLDGGPVRDDAAPDAADGGAVGPATPAEPAEQPTHPEVGATPPGRRTGGKPVNRPPSREMAGDWVVEIWIDPDWYAEQATEETCPSAAPPEVVRLRGSDAVIGRRSRTSVPDVDCGLDSAVSRRQAMLTSDGRRWWVEDLDSSNGTWVGPAIGPLPSAPITGRTEIDADDRIYVGAWTRLVVRPAVESELT